MPSREPQSSTAELPNRPLMEPRRTDMSPARTPAVNRRTEDVAVSQIIEQARRAMPVDLPRANARSCAVAQFAAGLLLWAAFTPLDWSPLAWIAPVPLLCLVRANHLPKRWPLVTWMAGTAFFLASLQWMRLGDPTMYTAWIALSVYLGCYWVAFLASTRHLAHRWGVPLVVAAPAVWTGLEYARSHLLTGMGWYLLGHTQYRWLELIQLSDVTGAYGVSFVVMTVAAGLTMQIPSSWLERWGFNKSADASTITSLAATSRRSDRSDWQAIVAVALVGLVVGYGAVRRNQADFQPGPRVALIQGNFTASARVDPDDFQQQHLMHVKLTGLAVREQPDLIVWPEGMWRWPLLDVPADLTSADLERVAPSVPVERWRDPTILQAMVNESQRAGAAMILGVERVAPSREGVSQYNSAAFVRPDVGLSGSYDKIHLVPFGEYLPLRDLLPWLSGFTPYRADMGLQAGRQASMFEYRNWTMAPVICFEDTVPHLTRAIARQCRAARGGRDVDLLVNLTNDGWFHGSSELDQHLITAAFRAVECRTPLVRAVNTGISAIIDGDGAIRPPDAMIDGELVQPTTFRDERGRWRKQLNAAVVSTVPLDHRQSSYVTYGDWFAGVCCFAMIMGLGGALRPKRWGMAVTGDAG